MKDISSIRLIKIKGALFFVLAMTASALLLQRCWNVTNAVLLLIVIWGFCRAYYFAFYVIQHYVDPSFRFSGLGAFCSYLVRAKNQKKPTASKSPIFR